MARLTHGGEGGGPRPVRWGRRHGGLSEDAVNARVLRPTQERTGDVLGVEAQVEYGGPVDATKVDVEVAEAELSVLGSGARMHLSGGGGTIVIGLGAFLAVAGALVAVASPPAGAPVIALGTVMVLSKLARRRAR